MRVIVFLLMVFLTPVLLAQDKQDQTQAQRALDTLSLLQNIVAESARRLDVGRLVSINANLDVVGPWTAPFLKEIGKNEELTLSAKKRLSENLSAIPAVAAEKVFTLSHDLVQRMFEHHIALVLELHKQQSSYTDKFIKAEESKEQEKKKRAAIKRLSKEVRQRFGAKGLLRLTVGNDREYRSYRDETNLMNLHGKRLALPGNDSRWLKDTIRWVGDNEDFNSRTIFTVTSVLGRVANGVDEDTDVKPRTILGAVVRAREEQRRAYLKILAALYREQNNLLQPRLEAAAK